MFTDTIVHYVRKSALFVTACLYIPLINGQICQGTWHGIITVYIWQDKCGAPEYLAGYETTGEHVGLSGEFIILTW